jgi:hypothetical protein
MYITPMDAGIRHSKVIYGSLFHYFSIIAIVFQDEASFFEINQSNDAIDVCQRYIAKSDPYLLFVSNRGSNG